MWFVTALSFTRIASSLISMLILNTSSHQIQGDIPDKIVSKYSEEERNALTLFRPMVEDVLVRDYELQDTFLIRWIRACHLDLKAAEEMLRKAQKWRKDYKMDTILEETPYEVSQEKQIEICNINGISYDGNPVFTVRAVKFDIRSLIMRGLKSNLTRQMNQCLERVAIKTRRLSQTTGRDITQAIAITDAGGYNLKQHACYECISAYLEFLRDGQNYHPGYTKLVVIVNAPKILKPLIQMAKPIMVSETLNAMHILGSDKREWTSFLLKHIPSDQLSSYFGGTAPCERRKIMKNSLTSYPKKVEKMTRPIVYRASKLL